MSIMQDLTWWQWVFMVLWVHRYARFIINTISHWLYKSYSIPPNPAYGSSDVTVIIPTIHHNFEELRDSLQSILACSPYELLLVTTSDKYERLCAFVKSLEASNVTVMQTPIANKRIQVCEAIPKVQTEFIIMADDDVSWPRTIIPWLLAPFEDKRIGGVGPCQRVKRVRTGSLSVRIYNWLGAAYIERRNFEISATHGIDGGTSCMSGRTCAFRSEILQSHLFLHGFKTECWGQYQLNADDDNFITRWLVSNKWKTWIQYNKECQIETTLENSNLFLHQCLRWARSNWRSNYTSLVTERHVWYQQPYCTYALHFATFTSLSFVFDPLIIWICIKATQAWSQADQQHALISLIAFMCISKIVKLIGLFIRDPSDILFLPVSVIFGYFHGLIKLYALMTLRVTSWGSRADGDANDSLRMHPRAKRSESITTPPGNHPGLVRYTDEKTYISEKKQVTVEITCEVGHYLDNNFDAANATSNDSNDFNDSRSGWVE